MFLTVLFEIDFWLLHRRVTPIVHWLWRALGVTQFSIAWWLVSMLPLSNVIVGAIYFGRGEQFIGSVFLVLAGWMSFLKIPDWQMLAKANEEYLRDPVRFENPYHRAPRVRIRLAMLIVHSLIILLCTTVIALATPGDPSTLLVLMTGLMLVTISEYVAAAETPPPRTKSGDVPVEAKLAEA